LKESGSEKKRERMKGIYACARGLPFSSEIMCSPMSMRRCLSWTNPVTWVHSKRNEKEEGTGQSG